MSKKSDPLDGWDSLILITLLGVIVTSTMAITAGLSWLWPLGYFIGLMIAIPVAIKNDEKETEKHD